MSAMSAAAAARRVFVFLGDTSARPMRVSVAHAEVNIHRSLAIYKSSTDAYPTEPPHVYVAPELTDAGKVQLLHLPSGAVRINSTVSFVIKRNGVKGNFDVRLETPSGQHGAPLQLTQLDPERFQVECQLAQAGLYKVHIKCNSVPLPKSPYIIVTIAGGTTPAEDGSEHAASSPASEWLIYSGIHISNLC